MDKKFHQLVRDRKDIAIRYDAETEAIWCYSKPSAHPFFTLEILEQYQQFQKELIAYFDFNHSKPETPVKFLVNASLTSNVFNYGGDLSLFVKLIEDRNRAEFEKYVKLNIDVTYLNYVNLNLPITTISLVEGDAIGGGLVSAISTEVCIVEEQSRMGFPGQRFSLMPGVCGYGLLAKLIGSKKTDKIILSGDVFDASRLLEMGVVNQVVGKGKGEEAVNSFIKNFADESTNKPTDKRAVSLEELMSYSEAWVDSAMKLSAQDLKEVQTVLQIQEKKDNNPNFGLRAKQCRRFEQREISFPLDVGESLILAKDRRKNRELRNL